MCPELKLVDEQVKNLYFEPSLETNYVPIQSSGQEKRYNFSSCVNGEKFAKTNSFAH